MARAKGWTCQRQAGGSKCQHRNPSRKQLCEQCGKRKPKRKAPAHMAALDLTYEQYVEINGGEHCGICGTTTTRLYRDHDHRLGIPRGLLCFRDNAPLRPYMTLEWLRKAVAYLERTSP